ncbi:putative membrane protein YccC [Aliiruegeria haliotis]|uniref:Putative membrane protein YccC n=1 Tax=Aliiruegeria haliotis TaxID=1280846 RepID=A0A2T0RGD7_9RHOB|nr:FUSC family protein [Aliiruegeria haliotis]PRY20233.1 putative membrane protein YccC [Aliiruegeria haliotis]
MNSARTRSALKLALAMVLAYWIALSMDWANPYWAGISIIACSLTTLGESMHKGLLRLGGTFIAIAAAIILIAALGQERWLFIAAVGLWLAFCVYRMFGTSQWYLWAAAGFVLPVLVVGSGGIPVNSFEVVVLRAQQTVLGVICYTLVYSLLWPTSSRRQFENGVAQAIALKRRFISATLDTLNGQPTQEDIPELRMQLAQGHASVQAMLDGAVLDSYWIWERQLVWKSFLSDMVLLDRELQRLYLNAGDIQNPQNTDGFTVLCDALREVDQRLSDVEKILQGDAPREEMRLIKLPDPRMPDSSDSHFQKAATSATAHNLELVLELGQSLIEKIVNLTDIGTQQPVLNASAKSEAHPTYLNPEMWIAVLRVQAIFLAIMCCVLFIPGFPNPSLVICIGISLAMNLALKPEVSVSFVMVLATVLMVVVGAIHMVLLPTLTQFWELAILLFVVMFVGAYFTSRPEQMILRSIILIMFLVGLQIDNQQSYSFLFFATVVIGLFCILTVVQMTRYFPISLRPEDRIEALIKRFFRSSEYVVRHSLSYDSPPPGWVDRILLAYHKAEIDTIPTKLVPWISVLPEGALRSMNKPDAFKVAASLEALSSKVLEFTDIRRLTQAEAMQRGGGDEMRHWRLAVADVMSEIVRDPGAIEPQDLETRLRTAMARLETTVENTLNDAKDASLEPSDYNHMYRLLGAYRGVSEELLGYSRQALNIKWPDLRESRF